MSLETKIAVIPKKPGVYQFFDADGKILYIGKAVSLRNRVASYFNQAGGHSGKTRVMVKKIADIRSSAMESVKDVAKDTAKELVSVMGGKADAKSITAAINARMKG